jgi:ribose-phosphate pyrophosphokinase
MKVIISTPEFAEPARQISSSCDFLHHCAHIKAYSSGEKQCFIDEDFTYEKQEIFIYHKLWPEFEKNILDLCMILVALEKYDNIRLVTPFLPLLRQDREFSKNSSIGSKILANILNSYNVKEIITFETHSEASQKFFKSNIINLNCFEGFYNSIKQDISSGKWKIISPDDGGIKRAKLFADICKAEYEALKKKRSLDGKISHSFERNENTNYIILDDMIDSGRTIISAANILKTPDNKIIILTTHLFNSSTIEKILSESNVHKIICSDTILHKNLISTSHIKEIINYISNIHSL